jgi:hypothetical protein
MATIPGMIPIPDPIDASARRLLKSSLRNIPELRTLAPEDALEIVKEAKKMAADEQDVSLYEKSTRLSNVIPFAIVILLLPILGLVLYFGAFIVEDELLKAAGLDTTSYGRRSPGSYLVLLNVIVGYYLFVRIYRHRTAQQMRPFILSVLKEREIANRTKEPL